MEIVGNIAIGLIDKFISKTIKKLKKEGEEKLL